VGCAFRPGLWGRKISLAGVTGDIGVSGWIDSYSSAHFGHGDALANKQYYGGTDSTE
jgi:hypothetical protein